MTPIFKMAAMKHVTLFFLFGVSFPSCLSKMEYLYFSSPGGLENGEDVAGLYGGPVETDTDDPLAHMYFSGYNCAVLKGKDFTEVDINSLSYDPVSKQVLLDMDPRLTIVSGELCQSLPSCINVTSTTIGLTPSFITAQGPQKMGPFAYYDSTIYFLLYEQETLYGRNREGKLELRKFVDNDGCPEMYPVMSTSVTFECSKLIAEIEKETFERYVGFRQGNHLLILKSPSGLQFMTMIQRMEFIERRLESYKMELVVINSDGSVKSLHIEPVADVFFQLDLHQIGSINFRDGVLCWSTITKVLCGDWDYKTLTNVRTVLGVGRAAQICKGSRITANVTTGVAIAQTDPQLEVYFGCMAKERGYGGAGIVRMPKKGENKTPEIKPLLNNGSTIYAGSMFLVNWCQTPRYIMDREAGIASASLISTNSNALIFVCGICMLIFDRKL